MNLVTGDNFKLFKKNNEKNILIGSWCLLDKRIKENFNENEYKVAKYHWDDKKKLSTDILYIEKVYKYFLDQLTYNLNIFHKTDYDRDLWQIILGMWLKQYISFLFDRWEQFISVSKNFKISEATLIKFDSEERFIPSNHYNYWFQIHHTNWNHWIFSKMVKNEKKLNFSYIEDSNQLEKKPYFYEGKESAFKETLSKFFLKFLPNQNLVISNLYLPQFYKLKLHLKYNKYIIKNNFEQRYEKKVNINSRKEIFNNIKGFDDFTNFLSSLLYLNIPCSFFENLKYLKEKAENSVLPQSPNMILTSTDYVFNDFFKIYCASRKREKNTKIIFFQHGSYFNLECALGDDFEANISDKFLTYGPSPILNKTIPLFMFNIIKKKIKKNSTAKGILISHFFSMSYPSEYNSLPRYYSDTLTYNNLISDFVKKINKNLLSITDIKIKKSNIRIYKSNFPVESLKKVLPKINFKYGGLPVWQESKKYKIVIETLNGTGFLEAMHLNIPVILLIKPTINQFKLKYKDYYENLKMVNILFTDGEKAAEFVNSIYENPLTWWNKKETQEIRRNFCSKFASDKKNK